MMFRPRLLVVQTLLIALAAFASLATAAMGTVVLRRIAVTGDHAPGSPPDVAFFGEFGVVALGIDRDGHVAFEALLAGPNVSAFEEGIWIERGGALTLVMRHGDQAPGLAPGVTFATNPFFLPLAPDVGAGRIAFRSILSGLSMGACSRRLTPGSRWSASPARKRRASLQASRSASSLRSSMTPGTSSSRASSAAPA